MSECRCRRIGVAPIRIGIQARMSKPTVNAVVVKMPREGGGSAE